MKYILCVLLYMIFIGFIICAINATEPDELPHYVLAITDSNGKTAIVYIADDGTYKGENITIAYRKLNTTQRLREMLR